jgi:hypothetical protein
MQFPKSAKSQRIIFSQMAREKILTDIGRPDLALIHHNIFYMTPLGQTLGPEMDKYIAEMPPKLGFSKEEAVREYLGEQREFEQQVPPPEWMTPEVPVGPGPIGPPLPPTPAGAGAR